MRVGIGKKGPTEKADVATFAAERAEAKHREKQFLFDSNTLGMMDAFTVALRATNHTNLLTRLLRKVPQMGGHLNGQFILWRRG
jgi:hypothetical protein